MICFMDITLNSKVYSHTKKVAVLLQIVVLILLLSVGLTSCRQFGANYRPEEQENSQWFSDNGNIFVKSNDKGLAYGYIDLNGEIIPVVFNFDGFAKAEVYGLASDGSIISIPYESWDVNAYHKNSFTAYVNDSVFFKSGDKIRFRKLKDSEKIDYEPSSFTSTEGNIVYDNVVDKNADILYSVIEEHTHSLDEQYDPHLMAIGILKYGIKEICEPRLMSDYGGLITVGFADVEGASYYLTYDIEDHKVVKISSAG